jgi:hypothetical protein
MPDLLIQNMDAAFHRRLSRLAREHGKSLSQLASELL